MARAYRVAVIGLGVIGRRMLTNMPAQGRLEVIGGWDRSEAARAKAATDFPWLRVAESAEALIAAPETDLVSIVGFGRLFELCSPRFLMEHFRALLFVLFAFALNGGLVWLERRVEYYAASRERFPKQGDTDTWNTP